MPGRPGRRPAIDIQPATRRLGRSVKQASKPIKTKAGLATHGQRPRDTSSPNAERPSGGAGRAVDGRRPEASHRRQRRSAVWRKSGTVRCTWTAGSISGPRCGRCGSTAGGSAANAAAELRRNRRRRTAQRRIRRPTGATVQRHTMTIHARGRVAARPVPPRRRLVSEPPMAGEVSQRPVIHGTVVE
jgi:hypothetical protein